MFVNVPKNSAYSKIMDVKATFMQGGYYQFDLTETLSIISLNSIYFNLLNYIDLA
jgi:hypothetical protein